MRAALSDYLLQRKQSGLLPRLLALLNPVHLKAGAGKYAKPAWSDDAMPTLLRAHWRRGLTPRGVTPVCLYLWHL
jgi:hypothetical protein